MASLFIYTFVAGVVMLALYLVYKWLFAGENQLSYNRVILSGIYLVSAVAPLMPGVSADVLALFGSQDAAAGAVLEFESPVAMAIETVSGPSRFWPVLLWIYTIGVAVVLIQTFGTLVRLTGIIRRGRKERYGDYILVYSDEKNIAPFSWMKYIVITGEGDGSADRMILLHETGHLMRHHWVDMLVAQFVAALLWYNPAAWLMREEFKAVHEYQADREVLRSGADRKEYQMLLIKKAVGARFPSLANSLNHSKLKKRITMMYKSNPTKASRRVIRALALVPALAAALSVTGLPAVAGMLSSVEKSSMALTGTDKVSEKITTVQAEDASLSQGQPALAKPEGDAPDKIASFPGGESAMFRFLMDNLKYPKAAENENQEGKAVVTFAVNTDGSLSDFEISKSTGSTYLDEEALRVARSMPNWEPAVQDGKKVKMVLSLPVMFKLPPMKKKDVSQTVQTTGTLKKIVLNQGGESAVMTDETGKSTTIVLNSGDFAKDGQPRIFVNGKEVKDANAIDSKDIASITVSKESDESKDGIIYITLKKKS